MSILITELVLQVYNYFRFFFKLGIEGYTSSLKQLLKGVGLVKVLISNTMSTSAIIEKRPIFFFIFWTTVFF